MLAAVPDLRRMLRPLGLQERRSARLIELSNKFIYDPPTASNPRPSRSPRKGCNDKTYPSTPISHLPGAGPYALDSFRIFSPMYLGGGAPTGEAEALDRLRLILSMQKPRQAESQVPESRESEWKKVIPLDKELRKYLASYKQICDNQCTLLIYRSGMAMVYRRIRLVGAVGLFEACYLL